MKIIEKANGKLGDLKNAEIGVFQIIEQKSKEKSTPSEAFNTLDRFKTGYSVTITLVYLLS
ncbi:MAG: hypothetical protein ACMUEM_01115 [Flavobacteriales bacterium AspAUS03]